MLSHGSGGPGASEERLRDFFIARGYTVGIVDYFTANGISSLGWMDQGPFADFYDATFKQIFDIKFPDWDKIVHLGFSLGGYVGLLHSEKFVKNYCFYPGIVGVTQDLLNKDYSNTTVILPELDTWCDNYYDFHQQCKSPPELLSITGAYHGFVLPNKQREILVTKYNTTGRILSSNEFNQLKFHHETLTETFVEKQNQIIRLQSNDKYSIMCLTKILSEIQDL